MVYVCARLYSDINNTCGKQKCHHWSENDPKREQKPEPITLYLSSTKGNVIFKTIMQKITLIRKTCDSSSKFFFTFNDST